jgi:hypothetical protein
MKIRRKEMRDTPNPRRWEDLAEETKSVAARMTDPNAKRMMREVVWGYQALAEHARKRERDRPLPPEISNRRSIR